ncbi:MAG: HD domain-containing protein [Chloroflexota bacterium]
MPLSPRFDEALLYASRLHRDQLRKGSQVPYLAHLMGVSALVIEDGGDEDQAIAGLLHDAVEDQGGQPTLDEIRRRFGERVAFIVAGCTDSFESPKPPWRERKERYLAHLRQAPPDVRRVSLADKLYNARAILDDLLRSGEQVWERFRGGKDGSLWYYRTLAEEFRSDQTPMAAQLIWVVEKIDQIARSSGG